MFENTLEFIHKFPRPIGSSDFETVGDDGWGKVSMDDPTFSYMLGLATPAFAITAIWITWGVVAAAVSCFDVACVDDHNNLAVAFYWLGVLGAISSLLVSSVGIHMAFEGYSTIVGNGTIIINTVDSVGDSMLTIASHARAAKLLMDVAIGICGPDVPSIGDETGELDSVLSDVGHSVSNISDTLWEVKGEVDTTFDIFYASSVTLIVLLVVSASLSLVMYGVFLSCPLWRYSRVFQFSCGNKCFTFTTIFLFFTALIVCAAGSLALLGSDVCIYDIHDATRKVLAAAADIPESQLCDDSPWDLLCHYQKCETANPFHPEMAELSSYSNQMISIANTAIAQFDPTVYEPCVAQLGAVQAKLAEIHLGLESLNSTIECTRNQAILDNVVYNGMCTDLLPGAAVFTITLFSCTIMYFWALLLRHTIVVHAVLINSQKSILPIL